VAAKSLPKMLDTQARGFEKALGMLLRANDTTDAVVVKAVTKIIAAVREKGDAAVLQYTARFDRLKAKSVAELELPKERLQEALNRLRKTGPGTLRPADSSVSVDALKKAAERIRSYAEKQKLESWSFRDDDNLLGQKVQPLDRVGLYVPGGKAAYPSSVLMNAIPAKVAGVGELIMTVPAPGGELNDWVLAAAAIAGVDRVFTVGGAQAVAALAYGTKTIPAVDKIVGPGNIYVATAKRLVFGQVGIDMIAGPSEIVVVCDGKTDPDWIAMDLFSQAEHGEDSQAILISPDADFIKRVAASIQKLLPTLERKDIVKASMRDRGALIKVSNLDEAIALVNRIAPEHLELSLDNPRQWLDKVRHAGAIFLGRYTAEALGDYCAGPNHVLPTSGSARFASPLGVYDFQKRSSIIECSPEGASKLGRTASTLARGEGLTAHARSAEYRIKPVNSDQ
jgi:histidinol dehydrogenase